MSQMAEHAVKGLLCTSKLYQVALAGVMGELNVLADSWINAWSKREESF